MADISKLQSYEDYIANNITEWEAESIARVCRKIGKIGRMSKKDLEKYDADKEAKKEWERIVAALAIATALNIRTLKKAYISEFEAWEKHNEYLYQYRGKKPLGVKNGALQGIIEKAVKQNGKDILNLTNTKALSVLDRNGNPIRFQDAIYKSFSDAVKTVTEGKADFYTTMRQTVQNLGGGGCRVNYGEGITRRLDTVVRQNMLYGIKQANNEYNEAIGKELNCDGYEVDAHNNPRQSHYFMQGKQYCIGKSRTINGIDFVGFEEIDPTSPDGLSASKALNDYGCRHYKTPIICGISEPRYSPEELKRLNEQNAKTYNINGKDVSGYEAQQMMRRVETAIREQKSIKQTAQASGDKVLVKQCNDKIKAYKGKYEEIINITGFYPETKRMSVPRKPKTN